MTCYVISFMKKMAPLLLLLRGMKKLIGFIIVVLTLLGSVSSFAAEGQKASTVKPEEFKISAEIDEFIRQVVSMADRTDYPISKRVSLYKDPTKKVLLGISISF